MKRSIFLVCMMLSLLLLALVLGGCGKMILLNPKGPIGESERFVIVVAFGLMLLVVVPVIVMSIWFPLKYRASNTKAAYTPHWSHSGRIETVMWLVPLAIVLLLSILAWKETHRLDPYRPIASEARPLPVQVVSLDWKWLFIYPEQQIAVVNELVFPAKVPVSFQITSDTVMTSFFIPQLGSQIYAMAGMRTRLHLLADEAGIYAGQNQQFSGEGYPLMTFNATATPPEKFEAWVGRVRQSPERLDLARLEKLRQPGTQPAVLYFSSIDPGLFEAIMDKYRAMPMHTGVSGDTPHTAHGKQGDRKED